MAAGGPGGRWSWDDAVGAACPRHQDVAGVLRCGRCAAALRSALERRRRLDEALATAPPNDRAPRAGTEIEGAD